MGNKFRVTYEYRNLEGQWEEDYCYIYASDIVDAEERFYKYLMFTQDCEYRVLSIERVLADGTVIDF